MIEIFQNGQWLPLVFGLLMGVAVVVYAVLDGYDLGVGILMRGATADEKDTMIASIGPFWDANETWLVLSVGLLLVAFPMAQGVVLGNLYLPVALMLIGLILRGVAFDFRAKVKPENKDRWNRLFFVGSLVVALTQGYMMGSYVLGFEHSLVATLFSLLVAVCVVAAYSLIGAGWLIMKTEGALQKKAIGWARTALWGTAAGIVLISGATPLSSVRILDKWFSIPEIYYMLPFPLITALLVSGVEMAIKRMARQEKPTGVWHPFAMTAGIFVMCMVGLAYSFYPYIVPDQMTIFQGAAAPESLMFILVGALIVLPVLFAYTFFAYRVFWGKVDMVYE